MFQAFCVQRAEDVLQRWDARKASGVWISVPTVLEKMTELITKDFVEYFKNGSGRDVKGSGLFVYNEDRKIYSVYTTDRSKKTTVKPVNCRQWKTLVQAYVDLSEANSAVFLDKVLSNHKDHINTARKLGPHTQTDRGTCPGGGL